MMPCMIMSIALTFFQPRTWIYDALKCTFFGSKYTFPTCTSDTMIIVIQPTFSRLAAKWVGICSYKINYVISLQCGQTVLLKLVLWVEHYQNLKLGFVKNAPGFNSPATFIRESLECLLAVTSVDHLNFCTVIIVYLYHLHRHILLYGHSQKF